MAMALGLSDDCCRGCDACENEIAVDMDLQAVVSGVVPDPSYSPPHNPFETGDCEADPVVYGCDFLNATFPLIFPGPGGIASPCDDGSLSVFFTPDGEGNYLGGYHRIAPLTGGNCAGTQSSCCWGGFIEMACTDSGDTYHDFGSWWGISLSFVKLYDENDQAWHLGAALLLESLYSGYGYYQIKSLSDGHKINCTALSITFDDLQIMPGTSGPGYCGKPSSIVIERI